ncbi:unnamed protein product [Polarella glacialis]|uniref:ATP-grasp domain-containing protein n=1 Tax=Polarella glacialis TaxID=89957 RepID=A0A813DHK3_POLGL|nr:unnamed protein product [Polarella glacialis]
MSGCGCFHWLQYSYRRLADSHPGELDRSPARAYQKSESSPSLNDPDLPRIGSWASPVPNSPTPWGIWGRETSVSDCASPGGLSMDFCLSLEENLQDAQKNFGPEIVTAQPRRIQEVGIGKSGQASPRRKKEGSGFHVEQLLASPGSLKQGQTLAEREAALARRIEKVLRELPKGASTCEKVAKTPRRLITTRGAHGQRLRRGLIEGAVIVFFTTGYEGKRFIYEKAHALGVRSVLIDSAGSWSEKLVEEGLAVKFIALDMSMSSDEVFREALKAIEAREQDPKVGSVDGVATFAELSVPVTARLAEALGLPGPAPESADMALDKHATRAALARAGLPSIKNYEICCEADVETAAKIVGFPAVLKPVSGVASLGVKKVESIAELRTAYLDRDRELLSQLKGKRTTVGANNVIGARFLLESYLDGDEVG